MSHEHLPGQGRSSFELIDCDEFLAELGLSGRETIVDLGCGAGRYALALAGALGPGGRVIGLDLWEEGLAALREDATARGLRNLESRRADIREPLPLDSGSADLALFATVFHDLTEQEQGVADTALAEARRVLRPEGRLALVEFKTVEPPPGPPRSIRLSPAQVDTHAGRHGFERTAYADLGPYTYLLLYRRT